MTGSILGLVGAKLRSQLQYSLQVENAVDEISDGDEDVVEDTWPQGQSDLAVKPAADIPSRRNV